MVMEDQVRVEDRSSPSWVVEMEKLLPDIDPSVEKERWKRPSIYRVPEWVKDMTGSNAYRPLLASLGPFHHGDPGLLPMEEHKQRSMLHMVKRSGKPLGKFVSEMEKVANELEAAYDNLDDKWRGTNRGRFVQLMIMDGCFLLEIMWRAGGPRVDGDFCDDYAANDPVFGDYGYLFFDIRSDMVVMENQLPLLALQKLVEVCRGTTPSATEVNNWVLYFLVRPLQEASSKDQLGLHPLDVFHKSFCGRQKNSEGSNQWEGSMPSAVELSEAGIRFKKCKNDSIHSIEFRNGVLSLPLVEIHDQTEKYFLNLMAFERMHRDAGSDMMTYIAFMDTIIDLERDVALLRSCGIIDNLLSSDTDVAKLFNTLNKGAFISPSSKLHGVKRMVNNHCRKRWNKWRASFIQTYMQNPWVFFSLLAAIILLCATVLQAIYAVLPYYRKS